MHLLCGTCDVQKSKAMSKSKALVHGHTEQKIKAASITFLMLTLNTIFEKAETMTFVLPDFGMDKAMVICGESGRILANKWAVSDISQGDDTQGTKHQAASAIAQKGFFAIKCSDDSCSVDGRAIGDFNIFPGTRKHLAVIVKQAPVVSRVTAC